LSEGFKIQYLSTAENDLDDIFDYIMKDNPSAAVSLLEKFDRSISQSAVNLEIGAVPKDDRLKKLGYRMLIVGKYLVFYVVKANTVQIRRIIHGARQYSFLL
jgi:addiction module RelE/StbE family toxin